MKIIPPIIALSVLVITGCGTMPDVTVDYYLPKVELELKVVQTAACSSDNKVAVMTSDIEIAPTYSSDSGNVKHIRLKDLDGTFTKGDVEFTFYKDGRLKSLNNTQTGQGGEVIKAALAIIPSLVLLGVSPSDCADLTKLNDKSLTVIHKGTIDFNTTSTVLKRETLTNDQFKKLTKIFGDRVEVNWALSPGFSICSSNESIGGIRHCGKVPSPGGTTLVTLVTPKVASFVVKAGPSSNEFVFNFDVPVPQKGDEYTLPIPKPPMFGGTRFGIELAPSGAVTKLKYGKDSGAASAMTAASDSLTALAGKSAALRAAEIEAEADLIAQQQRLVRCMADNTKCE